MSERQLFLISANKSRPSGQPWSEDDCDVREGAPDGPVIGRIYEKDVLAFRHALNNFAKELSKSLVLLATCNTLSSARVNDPE